ncbi:MAG TPA: hypothetical protein VFO89_12830 [Thermoanaerobaculia bacterium]|nr:hypothetical protein [Thermoanaerobaculia bacterium]
MTDVLGLLPYLLLPLIGIVVWRVDSVRRMTLEARLGVATAAGVLIAAVLMALLSLLRIEWSRSLLFTLLAAIIAAGVVLVRRAPRVDRTHPLPPQWLPFAGTAICVLVTIYATTTARQSCGDFQFTWGPKAIHFFRAGGIDPAVLKTYPQLTVDYPPLQTLLLALSNTFSHQLSWWAGVLASPLLLIALLAVIRGWSRDDYGTLLVAAALTWTYALAYPAGCAEPPLLLFETITIAGLALLDDPRAQTFAATLGMAGAVFTKLEGTTFAIAALLAILIVQRNAKRAAIAALPAAILIGGWMAFVFANDLLWMYRGAALPIYPETLPVVLKTLAKVARFESWWLPWIVPVVVIALGNVRRAAVPLAIAVLTSCATIYFYIHYPDPVWWIESSSPRVILTPLLALLIGAVAAHAKPSSRLC